MNKKVWAVLLMLCMVVAILPFQAFAAYPENALTKVEYYSNGELYRVQVYQYNRDMLVSSIISRDSGGHLQAVESYQYNDHHDLLKVTYESVDAKGNYTLDRTVQYTYNSAGTFIKEETTFADGHVVICNYNDKGWLIEQLNSYDSAQNIFYEYDSFGNITKETHKTLDGQIASYTERIYDREGREIRNKSVWYSVGEYYSEPFSEIWISSYDNAGQLIRQDGVDESGNTISDMWTVYTYDQSGNLIHDEWLYGDMHNQNYYTYDANGRLIQQISYPSNTASEKFEHDYSYDAAGNLISEEYYSGYGGSEKTVYTYQNITIPQMESRLFFDVSETAWYYPAVQWAVSHDPQITAGTNKEGTIFSPNMACTRSQMVTFLWRAAGCPEPKTTRNPFEDVKSSAYYYKAVLWAVENGITAGTNKAGTVFSPNMTVDRSQTVTFLWRFAGKPTVKAKNPFKDVSAKAYYYNAVLWAVKKEITAGTNKAGTQFSPLMACSRSQIVTFLYRYMGK